MNNKYKQKILIAKYEQHIEKISINEKQTFETIYRKNLDDE